MCDGWYHSDMYPSTLPETSDIFNRIPKNHYISFTNIFFHTISPKSPVGESLLLAYWFELKVKLDIKSLSRPPAIAQASSGSLKRFLMKFFQQVPGPLQVCTPSLVTGSNMFILIPLKYFLVNNIHLHPFRIIILIWNIFIHSIQLFTRCIWITNFFLTATVIFKNCITTFWSNIWIALFNFFLCRFEFISIGTKVFCGVRLHLQVCKYSLCWFVWYFVSISLFCNFCVSLFPNLGFGWTQLGFLFIWFCWFGFGARFVFQHH